MNRNEIAVCTDRPSLIDRLGELRSNLTFVPYSEGHGPSVILIDRGYAGEIPIHGRSRVRLFLTDGESESPRRFGDLHVPEAEFLRDPSEYLGFAHDLLLSLIRANDLQQEVDLFTEVRDLMSFSEVEPVFGRITSATLHILGLERGSLLLFDPRIERFTLAFTNDAEREAEGERLSFDLAHVLERTLDTEKPYTINRIDGADTIFIPIQIREDLIGFFTAPLRAGEKVEEEQIARASRYIRAVTTVIANVHQLTSSKDLAMRDDLTKAYNRRFFESYLDEEIERARRYGSVLSIIFLDLDDLKVVNNRHGHLTGSRVLQEVAKRILAAVRAIDKVVRFGGDEFCIILPQTDQQQAKNVANRVRRSLIESVFRPDPEIEIPISASFGIATYPYHAITKEDLIRQADDAMYRIKSSSKNAIGIAGDFDSPRINNNAG